MAMSLEELLAKEGFKDRKPKMLTRAFTQFHTGSMLLYPYRDQHKLKTSSAPKKHERVKSDIPRSGWSGKLPPTDRTNRGRSKSIHVRKETLESEDSIEKSERVAKYLDDAQRLTVESSEHFVDSDKAEGTFNSSNTCEDIYANEKYSSSTHKRAMERIRSMEGTRLDDRKSMKQLEKSYNRSKTMEQRQKVKDEINQIYAEVEQNSPEPAMDEAAIRAVISILCGYIKRFLSDGDFRTLFHHNCFASLHHAKLEEGFTTESKVLENLEQAIEVVERAAVESVSARELKKASLQLSVITGLSSNELKDGFTSGIPNSKLSACAHLYLSVVYKLQKKDRVAAKHLLQVFYNSPFQARMILLPELWVHMFFPHLVHLKEWYNQKVDLLGDTPRKGRKLKLLDKVYNEIIDSGTCQFAVYYKDWLSDGVESPSIPSINVPTTPFQGVKQGSSSYSSQVVYEKGSSSGDLDMGDFLKPLSPQPTVSKKLYDAKFGWSSKPEVGMEGFKTETFPNNLTSYGRSHFEEKQALPCSSTAATHTEQIEERHEASLPLGLNSKKNVKWFV